MTARAGAPALDDPVIRPVSAFSGARDHATPMDRLRAVVRAAEGFREQLLDGPQVRFFHSQELVRFPYPSRFGFLNALAVPTPYVHLCNRVFVVQFDSAAGVKTLLVSPSDVDANAETPYFKRMLGRFGPFRAAAEKAISRRGPTVEEALAGLGIRPADVDYITYDHLHTQDLRGWLGTRGAPGRFPNAKLLVMRAEWDALGGLLPWHRDWYCPSGADGVDPGRVILLDGDVLLGDGVALMATPGHTEGNHSIVCHTPEGLFVTSENGIGPDAYAPLRSRIPGLARFARDTGMGCVMNGNTLERGNDQYISMIQEKTVAGPSRRHPDFPNVACSSELAAFWMFPGITPTFSVGDLRFGAPVGG